MVQVPSSEEENEEEEEEQQLSAADDAEVEPGTTNREFIFDHLLVQIYLIIEMILVDRPCAMGV